MKNRKITIIILFSSLLLLSACNFPRSSSAPSPDDQVATVAAMTLGAQITSTLENTPLPTPSPTLAVTKTPTPTITPTYSIPMLTVDEPTNCRTGPGQSYDIIIALLPGASVEIVGRYPTNNYWTVKVQGLGEPCWLWGEYATVSGSTWTVPSVTPPATATPSPPSAPSISNWDYLCGYSASGSNATVNLKWNDRAEDELGYRIYRDDERVMDLPANSTTYSETIDIEEGEPISYWIEVFNNAGASTTSKISFTCQ